MLKISQEAVVATSSTGQVDGKIVIGANESFSVARLPHIIKHFRAHYPDVSISLKFDSVSNVHTQIQNNVIDIAFFLTRKLAWPDVIVETLLQETLIVIASPEHPFRKRQSIGFTDLAGEDLIITHEGCTYRSLVDSTLDEHKIIPRSLIEVNSAHTIKQLVMNGLGIALVPQIAAEAELSQGLLVGLPFVGPEMPVFTQIAYHKDKWISPTLLSFLKYARKICCH